MKNQKLIKIVGFSILIISCVLFLLIVAVPFMGFTKAKMAIITTILIVSGEVLFYTSLFILGKSYWTKIKGKLMFWKSKEKEA